MVRGLHNTFLFYFTVYSKPVFCNRLYASSLWLINCSYWLLDLKVTTHLPIFKTHIALSIFYRHANIIVKYKVGKIKSGSVKLPDEPMITGTQCLWLPSVNVDDRMCMLSPQRLQSAHLYWSLCDHIKISKIFSDTNRIKEQQHMS